MAGDLIEEAKVKGALIGHDCLATSLVLGWGPEKVVLPFGCQPIAGSDLYFLSFQPVADQIATGG